jgi:hypothetical protein
LVPAIKPPRKPHTVRLPRFNPLPTARANQRTRSSWAYVHCRLAAPTQPDLALSLPTPGTSAAIVFRFNGFPFDLKDLALWGDDVEIRDPIWLICNLR